MRYTTHTYSLYTCFSIIIIIQGFIRGMSLVFRCGPFSVRLPAADDCIGYTEFWRLLYNIKWMLVGFERGSMNNWRPGGRKGIYRNMTSLDILTSIFV